MPTYEYHCDSCEKNFDLVQSFDDDPLTHCPTCGSPVRKVFGNVGIVFKGSGFYKTDSRNGSSAKAAESNESAPAPPSDSERSTSAAEPSSSTPSDATAKPSPSPSTKSPDKSSPDKAKASTGRKSTGADTSGS